MISFIKYNHLHLGIISKAIYPSILSPYRFYQYNRALYSNNIFSQFFDRKRLKISIYNDEYNKFPNNKDFTTAYIKFISKEEWQLCKNGNIKKSSRFFNKFQNYSNFSGEYKQSELVYSSFLKNDYHSLLILFGLGEEKDLNINKIRISINMMIKILKEKKIQIANLFFPMSTDITKISHYHHSVLNIPSSSISPYQSLAFSIAQSAILNNYHFDYYLSKKKNLIQEFNIIAPNNIISQIEPSIQLGRIISTSTSIARDIINEGGSVHNPAYFEQLCEYLADKSLLSLHKITGLDALYQNGYSLIAEVGKAAIEQPRLLSLTYHGGLSSNSSITEHPIALVGKGITFDSGGYNFKSSLKNMHADCAGAVAVLMTLYTISLLRLPINVVGIIAVAENTLSPVALKPADIIKSASGLSIEITNTDAEGRLILADAFHYAQHYHQCSSIIDIATLTGSCQRSLGEFYAGLWSNDQGLAASLKESGSFTSEFCWEMPLSNFFSTKLESSIADIKNHTEDSNGGCNIAAAFLQNFIKKNLKWAHLDIAGTGFQAKVPSLNQISSSPFSQIHPGSTGFGVALLTHWLWKQSQSKL